MANTEVDLIKELKKAKIPKRFSTKVRVIMLRAKSGHYHDLKSNMIMPKVGLVLDLQAVGLKDLAMRAENGEFDEKQPTSKQLKMRRQILDNVKSINIS